MKKIELLAPAGSFEALQAAIAAGCDAVYLGGSGFGARAYAKNFDNEEMIKAIKYAHVYGVSIYVTINTLIYDHEIKEVIDYITFLYNHDVDAIIVQDLGLMHYVRKHFPLLEVHASTQMTLHNLEGIKLLEEEKVSRAVLARENTIHEIKKISENTTMELEVFVHGALCVCYSGQCLMSSLIGGRSGNRGKCAQPCRKLYRLAFQNELIDNEKYMLSPKDLNTIEHIGELIEAGVRSLKIEGRMKSPEYVAIVVSNYRRAIDQYYDTKQVKLSQEDKRDLAQIFNRQFTKGFLFGANGNDFINLEKNNNSGLPCGEVISSDQNQIKIKLSHHLYLNDGIYFDQVDLGMKVSKIIVNKKEVTEAKEHDIVTLDVKKNVPKGITVYKTTDVKLLEKAQDIASHLNQIIPLKASVTLFIGQKPKLTLSDLDGNIVTKEVDFIIESGLKQTLDEDKVRIQLNKLGNTPFYFDELDIRMDEGIFVVISILNQLRRDAIDSLISIRENKNERKEINLHYEHQSDSVKHNNNQIKLSVYCHTMKQVDVARRNNIKTIYVSEELYKDLDQKDDVFITTSRINHHLNIKNQTKGYLISELGSLQALKNEKQELVSNVNLNVTNSESINYLLSKGMDYITLSYEMNDRAYKHLAFQQRDLLEVIVYGYQEAMVTKHCIFASNCQKQCHRGTYTLIDEKNENFNVYMDSTCHMHILNSKKMILSDEVLELIDFGYSRFRIQLTVENEEESQEVISAYQQLLNYKNNEYMNEIVEKNKQSNAYTRGYFNKNIL